MLRHAMGGGGGGGGFTFIGVISFPEKSITLLVVLRGGRWGSNSLEKKRYQALTLSNLDHWPRGPVDLRGYWSTNSRHRQHSHSL